MILNPACAELVEVAKSIRLIAFDVDGVMTDGGLYLSDSGEEFKRFNSLDGHGLKMLKASDRIVWIDDGRLARICTPEEANIQVQEVH